MAGLDAVAEGTALGTSDTGLWSYNSSKAAAIVSDTLAAIQSTSIVWLTCLRDAQHLTKTLAATLARRYITVNAICPGVYASRMTAYGLKENGDHIKNAYPMGRIGTPEDIAGLLIFLSSRAGAHISGTFIESDGGSQFTSIRRAVD